MAIKQIKVWEAKCEVCGRNFEGCDVIWYTPKKKDMIEMIEGDDWWEYINGKVYCSDCVPAK